MKTRLSVNPSRQKPPSDRRTPVASFQFGDLFAPVLCATVVFVLVWLNLSLAWIFVASVLLFYLLFRLFNPRLFYRRCCHTCLFGSVGAFAKPSFSFLINSPDYGEFHAFVPDSTYAGVALIFGALGFALIDYYQNAHEPGSVGPSKVSHGPRWSGLYLFSTINNYNPTEDARDVSRPDKTPQLSEPISGSGRNAGETLLAGSQEATEPDTPCPSLQSTVSRMSDPQPEIAKLPVSGRASPDPSWMRIEAVQPVANDALIRQNIDELTAQIKSLMNELKWDQITPLETALSKLVDRISRTGIGIREAFIVLMKVEQHKLQLRHMSGLKTDLTRYQYLLAEARNVVG